MLANLDLKMDQNTSLKYAKRVKSVGDSWVIVKSKSYPERVYYFNTLTGQSVWNLGQVEINKSMSCGDNYEGCVEPTEPPDVDEEDLTEGHTNILFQSQSKKCHQKQIINSQYAPAPPVQYDPTIPPPPLFQHPIAVPYNNVWPVPSTHTFFTIPSYQPDPSYERVAVQNTSISLSSRFGIINSLEGKDKHEIKITEPKSPNPRFKTNYSYSCKKSFRRRKSFSPNKVKKVFVFDDLREKLKLKRMASKSDLTHIVKKEATEGIKDVAQEDHNIVKNVPSPVYTRSNETEEKTCDSDMEIKNNNTMNPNEQVSHMVTKFQPEPSVVHKIHIDGDDDNDEKWLSNNMLIKETQKKLDVNRLKDVAGCNDSDLWYILADTNVFLSNMTFLDTLVNSDENCRLLLARQVYDELTHAARGPYMDVSVKWARSACRYVARKLTDGKAVRDINILHNPRSDVGCPIGDDQILDCCLRLIQQNFHVILLSNDTVFLNKTHISSIPTFTVSSLKKFLSGYRQPNDVENINNPIVISINNKNTSNSKNNTSCESYGFKKPDISINDNVKLAMHYESLYSREKKSTESESANNKTVHEDASSKNKKIVDVKIQTDLASKNGPTLTVKLPVKIQNSLVRTLILEDKNIQVDDLITSNDIQDKNENTSKKRDIRLKRNFEPNNGEVYKNKSQNKFKWRRKKSDTNQSRALIDMPNDNIQTSNQRTGENHSNKGGNSKTVLIPSTSSNNRINNKQKNNKNETTNANSKLPTINQIHVGDINQEIDKQMPFLIDKSMTRKDSVSDTSNYNDVSLTENVEYKDKFSSSGSDVISNSRSSVFSCKLLTVRPKKEDTHICPSTSNHSLENLGKNVIIQITDPAMEERLKIGCEEWVSRFVQIMEEVLTQILQELNVNQSSMPPPWNIHQAVNCIKQMNSCKYSVRDAAYKLSNILVELSDERGNVMQSMQPAQYMKMFSYGLYLINSLRKSIGNSEDIQCAFQLLSDLLSDIEKPRVFIDTSTTLDQLNDISLEANNQSTSSVSRSNNAENQECCLDNDAKIQENRNKLQNVIFKRNIDVDAKTIKQLRKRNATNDVTNFLNNTMVKCNSQQSDVNIEEQGKSTEPMAVEKNKITYPKITAKFTVFPEFEERLKNQARHINGFDFEDLNYEHTEDEEEHYESEFEEYVDDFDPDIDLTESAFRSDFDINTNMELLVKRFLRVMKDMFLDVQTFCEQTYSEVSRTDKLSLSRKEEIQEQAKHAHSLINKLLKKLHSIVERETIDPLITNNQLSSYRDIVVKCTSQAEILLDNLSSITNKVQINI